MSRALASRVERLASRVGWRYTVLRDDRGQEMTVSTLLLVDACLRVQLTGGAPNLPPRIAQFLARARVRSSDGAVIATLHEVCRDLWVQDREER